MAYWLLPVFDDVSQYSAPSDEDTVCAGLLSYSDCYKRVMPCIMSVYLLAQA